MKILLLSLAFLGGCAGAVLSDAEADADAQLPTRRSVQRAAMESPVWRVMVCETDGRELAGIAADLAAAEPAGKTIEIVACDYAGPHDRPTLVLGDRVPPILGGLPVGPDLTLNDSLVAGPDDLVFLHRQLLRPRPDTGQWQIVSLFLGRNPARLATHLRDNYAGNYDRIFWNQWAYEVYSADGTQRFGDYAGDGWSYATNQEVVLRPPGPPVYDADGLRLLAHDLAPAAAEVTKTVGALDRIAELLAGNPRSAPGALTVHLYPSVERIGLRTGRMRPAQFTGGELHLVPTFLTPAELIRDTAVWRAALLRNGAPAGPTDDIAVRRDAFAASLPAAPPIDRQPPSAGFLRGMTVAHEGYRGFNGYGGSLLEASLDSLQRLSVNAVAIVPYTFMRDPNVAVGLPIPDRAGSENDAAVSHAIRRSRARGCFVLLKPQIWLRNSWPGDIDFATPAEWDTFFREYERWILHYARLAQREGAGALCLGTELRYATLKHPDRWRAIIRSVRAAYDGQVTYAANWGEEFENLTFWDALDAVGLNSYYPLSANDDPTDAELLAGARRWMTRADSLAAANGKPLWLTEVGYRSVTTPWKNPHAEPDGRPYDGRAQARCYAALATAAAESDQLRGAFFWKWPSYLGRAGGRGGENTGFTPGGKPAGRVLTDFYRGRAAGR